MSWRVSANLAASMRQRLLNLSRTRQEELNLLLTWYAVERCPYRLSKTRHEKQFILKGATFDHVVTDRLQEMVDTNFKFYKRINDDRDFGKFFLDWLFLSASVRA